MNGGNLARYVMLINLTVGTSGLWAAQSQQPPAADAPASAPASSIEIPVAKSVPASDQRPGDWLLQPKRDAASASKTFISDQKDIWTSPLRLKLPDAEWLVPALGITAGALLTDKNFSRSLPDSPGAVNFQNQIRTGSVAALGAASGGLFLLSLKTHDAHQRETGLLASEAIVDSLVAAEGLKFVAGRDRPDQGTGDGRFFQARDSFP